MSEPDEDWRLLGARDLEGRTLHWKRWTRPKPSWDHDHCMGCWAKFMEEDLPDVLHEGYTTGEDYPFDAGYAWVCPTCFSDLKAVLAWTAAEDGDGSRGPEIVRQS